MITKLNDRIWTISVDFKVFGLVQLNGRCTIIRCSDGALWVHSPVRLTAELKSQIDQIGQVKYLVAPSLFHHLFVGQWSEAYPEAKVYAPQGLHKKQPHLRIDHILNPERGENCYAWSKEIDHIAIEGMPAVNEFIFYERVSQTMLITDLCFYFKEAKGFTKLYLKLNKVYQKLNTPLLFKSVIKDKSAFKQSMQTLQEWAPKQISCCHHAILTEEEIHLWEKLLKEYQ